MKAVLFAVVAAFGLQATFAAAHANHHHIHHAKRDAISEPVSVASQEVRIYVDSQSNTLSQETNYLCQPMISVAIPAPEPKTTAVSVDAAVPSESSASCELSFTTAGNPSANSSPSTGPAPPTEDYPDGLGICYSPYNDDGSCKNQKQVNADFELLIEYSLVRIYGVDCNQVITVLNAAKATNKKVFAGVFNLVTFEKDLETIISAVKDTGSSWSHINTVSIGNELVNQGVHPVSEVVHAVRIARSTLRSAGYRGPVVTVDTFNALIANPELCSASDYCAANCHPFFDPNTSAEDAGFFVAEQVRFINDVAGGDKVTVITETGWPSQGATNGLAVPSAANQKVAVESLKRTLKSGKEAGLYLLSAFDTKWKSDSAGTFSTEKYWGIEE